MTKQINDVFNTNENIDLKNAVDLKQVKTAFTLESFMIMYSKKFASEFVVIETTEGVLITTWSKIIVDKFKTLTEMPIEKWCGIKLQPEVSESKNGYIYYNLKLVK